MASSTSFAVLAMVLFALPITTFALDFDDIAPSLAREICKEVECGKGRCEADGSFPLGFTCKCESGWSRTHDKDDDDDDDDLKFLPCVIPDCSLNYGTCQPAPPPVPEKEVPHNLSAFDPCYWAYCGEGRCTKHWTHKHTCECNAGFFNLLNVTAFPCYSECTLGSDCSRLGIKVANSNSTDDAGSSPDDNNHGTYSLPGKLQWMAILMVSFGVAMFN